MRKASGRVVRSGEPRHLNDTTAGRLLDRAIRTLGDAPLAEALQLSAEQLRLLASSDKPLSLPQQRFLAIAVLAITQDLDLRRRANSLIDQVRAAEELRAGESRRHATAPPSVSDWKFRGA